MRDVFDVRPAIGTLRSSLAELRSARSGPGCREQGCPIALTQRYHSASLDGSHFANAFVLIMSPRSQASEWTHKEILLAKRYQKPVLPLLLEGQHGAHC